MTKFPITIKGFRKLEQELKHLKYVERLKITADISTAREFGDLSENAEYKAAKERQMLNDKKIYDLENKLANAEVIEITKISSNLVKFGAKVVLLDQDTEKEVVYQIVGEYEADIAKNLISIASPIAQALIGKKIGDIIEVITPKGGRFYELLKIQYVDF
ncbi:transcription elongation factor GreA domain protein [Orientia chuto str. Dubai]|uniref:Transcription elongation factor GreA n=1 Tax=Orientia chuto str. Dubai TaxID=1359168 RepID=A0A0F3MMG7_9RICK|nr:transcription elongation factor GreA [Candidatus Orientia mediorientalis]KJV55784.1 transcription elongation factor GreA domain protein [Orientia chuto str. Dubai]